MLDTEGYLKEPRAEGYDPDSGKLLPPKLYAVELAANKLHHALQVTEDARYLGSLAFFLEAVEFAHVAARDLTQALWAIGNAPEE